MRLKFTNPIPCLSIESLVIFNGNMLGDDGLHKAVTSHVQNCPRCAGIVRSLKEDEKNDGDIDWLI